MGIYRHIKSVFDIAISIIVLILSCPIFIIISILIKLDSRGPVFYRQERLGKGGKVFKIYKFRTMVDGAINMGGGIHTFDRDPRITRVGSFLRRTSLDELPQFINVIKGDMSIIGPRPPVPYYPRKYGEYDEMQKRRFLIKPGITGYAQVMVRNGAPWDQRILLDLKYLNSMSLWTDLYILFRTIAVVVKGNNIYF